MKSALKQFIKGSTTYAQSQEKVAPDQPVLVVCTDPPFRPSFFESLGIDENPYFWFGYPSFREKLEELENDSSMLDVYMNMTYNPGSDWNILVLNPKNKSL